jgi:hypothetical protein
MHFEASKLKLLNRNIFIAIEFVQSLNIKSIPTDSSTSEIIVRKMKHYTGNIASSVFPQLYSIYCRREKFENGVSAVVITKDDIWLDESLKSVENYVDELVVVDSSSEEYLKRNKRLVSELRIPEIKHIVRDLNKREARKLAFDNCTRNWILVWDGDVVAMDEGINNFSELMKYVRSLDTRKYYYKIFFPQILIGKNFREVQKQHYHVEAWVVSNSSHFKWNPKKIWDRGSTPLFFKKRVIDVPYALHINHIRTREMELNRTISIEWYKSQNRGENIDYETFYESHKGVSKLPEFPEGELYDENSLGKIPKILNKYRNLEYDQILELKQKSIFGAPTTVNHSIELGKNE